MKEKIEFIGLQQLYLIVTATCFSLTIQFVFVEYKQKTCNYTRFAFIPSLTAVAADITNSQFIHLLEMSKQMIIN